MKIIGKSNFDNQSVGDILICNNVDEFFGQKIVDFLNLSDGQDAEYYYRLVSDDYKFYSFES